MGFSNIEFFSTNSEPCIHKIKLLTCFAVIAEIKVRVLCMESEYSTDKKRQGLTNFSRLALNPSQSQLIICLCQQAKWSTYSESRADGTSEGRKQC